MGNVIIIMLFAFAGASVAMISLTHSDMGNIGMPAKCWRGRLRFVWAEGFDRFAISMAELRTRFRFYTPYLAGWLLLRLNRWHTTKHVVLNWSDLAGHIAPALANTGRCFCGLAAAFRPPAAWSPEAMHSGSPVRNPSQEQTPLLQRHGWFRFLQLNLVISFLFSVSFPIVRLHRHESYDTAVTTDVFS